MVSMAEGVKKEGMFNTGRFRAQRVLCLRHGGRGERQQLFLHTKRKARDVADSFPPLFFCHPSLLILCFEGNREMTKTPLMAISREHEEKGKRSSSDVPAHPSPNPILAFAVTEMMKKEEK